MRPRGGGISVSYSNKFFVIGLVRCNKAAFIIGMHKWCDGFSEFLRADERWERSLRNLL